MNLITHTFRAALRSEGDPFEVTIRVTVPEPVALNDRIAVQDCWHIALQRAMSYNHKLVSLTYHSQHIHKVEGNDAS